METVVWASAEGQRRAHAVERQEPDRFPRYVPAVCGRMPVRGWKEWAGREPKCAKCERVVAGRGFKQS